MKKLMTMLAAVATAFGLYAIDTDFVSGAGFDSEDTAKYTWTLGTSFSELWSGVTAENAKITQGQSADPESTARPLEFVEDEEPVSGSVTHKYDGFLTVTTTLGNPIGQYVKGKDDVWDISAQGDGALYFDAMVKPTVFDEMPDVTAYENAKIGVFVYQSDENDATTKKLFVWAAGSETNFWETTTEIDDTQWYRLTIKMIDEIGTGKPGYVVFVNGTKVRCNAAKLDPAGLTPAAAEWNATGSLFEGLTTSTEVKEVLFDGKGDVDEIAFTKTAPDFAKDTAFATITWDADKVDTITIDGDPVDNTGSATVKVDDGPFTIVWTGTGDYIGDTATFTPTKDGDTVEVTENAKTAEAFVIDGATTSKYETVAAAIAQAAGKTVQLRKNVGALAFTADATITLDLNGKTVTALAAGTEELAVPAIRVAAGALTVVDSAETAVVTGALVEEAYVKAAAVDKDESTEEPKASLIINAGTFIGSVFATKVNDGKFDVASNSGKGGRCAVEGEIPTDKEWVNDGSYWYLDHVKVAQIEGDPVKKFTSLAAAVAAADEDDVITVFADTEETNVYATVNLTITNNANVTFVAASNYSFQVTGSAKVTLEGNGTWKRGKDTNSSSLFQVVQGGTGKLTVNGGTFIAGDDGMESTNQNAPNNILQAKGGSIEVNGGTFTNYRHDINGAQYNGHCVVAENAGTEVTINGGSFTAKNIGALPVYAKDNGTLKIPGMVNEALNTAKFNQDETAYCIPQGTYKTKKNGDWYEVVAIQYATLAVTADEGITYTLTNTTTETVITLPYQADIDNAEVIEAIDIAVTTPGYELDVANCVKTTTLDSTTPTAINLVKKASTLAITYKYVTNGAEIAKADIAGLVNGNAESFTVAAAVAIDTAKITATDYTVTAVDPTGWAAGEKTAAVEVTVTLAEKAAPVPVPVDDPTALDEKGLENAQTVKDTFGDGLTAYTTAMGYTDGKIPAEKLNKTTDELIAAAKEYDLKIMANPVEVKVEATDEANTFKFTLSDADKENQNPLVAATKIQKLVQYTTALGEATPFAPSDQDAVEVALDDEEAPTCFTAKLTGNDLDGKPAAAGFMKVEIK